MNEFELIKRYFSSAAGDAVLGVGDDAAIVRPSAGADLHVSVDTLVSGRHFFADVDPAALGHKTLAVNLSDMAAMGARPRWALLSLALPAADERWLHAFASGFFALAQRYGVALIGGDTTCGPLTLSVTIMGETPTGAGLCRHAARVGDDIWVSGALGLAAAAVRQRVHADLQMPTDVLEACRLKLERPEPRVALGLALQPLAHAAIDVSDGLMADLGHILSRSGVGAELSLPALPTHPWIAADRARLASLLVAGGDDYELCFTADKACRAQIEALSSICPVSRIGQVVAGSQLHLLDAAGTEIMIGRTGFDHFQSEA